MKKTFLLAFLNYISTIFAFTTTFALESVLQTHRSRLNMVYEGFTDPKVLVSKSEMIIAIPTEGVTMKDIGELKKLMPPRLESLVMGSVKMIDAVDSTPFCMLADHIKGASHLFFFIDDLSSPTYESFLKWVRTISKDISVERVKKTTLLVAKKGHVISIEAK